MSRKTSRRDVIFRRSHRGKSVSSTMIWHAVVCDEWSPCKLTHQYHSLGNTFKYASDLVSQFGMAGIVRINAILSRAVLLLCVDNRYGPRLTNCWLSAVTSLSQCIDSDDLLVSNDVRKFEVAMSKSISLIHGPSLRFQITILSSLWKRFSY
jgi:hypothetical protein